MLGDLLDFQFFIILGMVKHVNAKKWLVGPTQDQIRAKIKSLGVTIRHFEHYHGIPKNTIQNVLYGFQKLPIKYWHLIFDEPVQSTVHKPKTKKAGKAAPASHEITGAISHLIAS